MAISLLTSPDGKSQFRFEQTDADTVMVCKVFQPSGKFIRPSAYTAAKAKALYTSLQNVGKYTPTELI